MATPERETPKHETVMDVTEEQIARVYAQAFMGVVSKLPQCDALVEELNSLVSDVLDRFPKLEQTLESSLVGADQKEQLLDRVFGKSASNEVLNFLKVLSRHDRLQLVRTVARLAKKLNDKRLGRTDIEIRVAMPLEDAMRSEIESLVRRALKTEPVLNVTVDPSLLAGIVIRVGDRVYDGSVHTRLEQVRAAMIGRATEQIETRPERFAIA
jgi:F-type H+-transporting ATPase subunit delta